MPITTTTTINTTKGKQSLTSRIIIANILWRIVRYPFAADECQLPIRDSETATERVVWRRESGGREEKGRKDSIKEVGVRRWFGGLVGEDERGEKEEQREQEDEDESEDEGEDEGEDESTSSEGTRSRTTNTDARMRIRME